MVLTVCIAIILCRPHYGNAVTSDNVTKWRRDIIRPHEILRPGTEHWRLCALRQSGGASICVLQNGSKHWHPSTLRQSGGATVFNREQKLLVVNIIAVSLSDQIFHSHSLL